MREKIEGTDLILSYNTKFELSNVKISPGIEWRQFPTLFYCAAVYLCDVVDAPLRLIVFVGGHPETQYPMRENLHFPGARMFLASISGPTWLHVHRTDPGQRTPSPPLPGPG